MSSRPESAERRDPGLPLPPGEVDAFHAAGEGARIQLKFHHPPFRPPLCHPAWYLARYFTGEDAGPLLRSVGEGSVTIVAPGAIKQRIGGPTPKNPILHNSEKISSIRNTTNKEINLAANTQINLNITPFA